MIAMAAMSEKLATMAARLTAACPGAPRSCAMASAAGTWRGSGSQAKNAAAVRGITATAPSRRQAMEA